MLRHGDSMSTHWYHHTIATPACSPTQLSLTHTTPSSQELPLNCEDLDAMVTSVSSQVIIIGEPVYSTSGP